MNDWVKLILSLSISGSILALLLFAVKPFIKDRVSRTFQYYIWLLVFLRLIFPFSFESSLMNGLFFVSGPEASTSGHSDVANSNDSAQVGMNQVDLSQAGSSQTDSGQANLSHSNKAQASALTVLQKIIVGYYNKYTDHAAYINDLLAQSLLYIWVLGVLVSLVYNISGYLRFLSRLKPANTPVSAQENELLQMQINATFQKQKNIRLFRNRFSTTPMLIGLFRPSVVIPDIPFTQIQLESILRHELTHLRRRDVLFKWFVVMVSSLHWFNPLLFFVKREMNRACELSCDESVISRLDRDQRQAYGETLIAVVAERKYPVGVLSTTMCEEKRTLKERLTAIMNYGKGTKKVFLLPAILLAVLLGVGVVLGAGVGRHTSGGSEGLSEGLAAGNTAQVNAPGGISISAGNKAGAKTGTLLSSTDYDLTGIAKYKTQYVGNHGKDLSLVASLPLPDTFFMQQYISLKTKEEPYGLTAYYEAAGNDVYPGEWPVLTTNTKLEVNSKLNALVLFTMIGNVNDITFAYRGTKSTAGLEMESYETLFSFSRKEIEDGVGSLAGLSDNPERLAAVIDDAAAKWAVDIANPETQDQIKAKIDKALTAIMNSPMASSNTWDYIRTHQKEYDEIAKMGKKALPYVKDILDSGDRGLRGRIVEQLYMDITGGSKLPDTSVWTGTAWIREASAQTGTTEMPKASAQTGTTGITEATAQTGSAGMPEFSDEEVASARSVVEKFYSAIEKKDADSVLATLYLRKGQTPEKVKSGYSFSFDEVNRTLVSITYDSQDRMRKTYKPGDLNITADNIIVFRTSFDIHYPGKADGSWNEGRYDNWAMILIRNNTRSPWLIYDQGY